MTVRAVTPSLLRAWPLPHPDDDAGKEERGRVLVIGGSTSMPGAVLLAGLAALRVGAGKLQLAVSRSVAPTLAVAVPEALVVPLDEMGDGTIDGESAGRALAERAADVQAVVVGAGMSEPEAAHQLVAALVAVDVGDGPGPALILDAAAITCLAEGGGALLEPARARIVLTPNPVEASVLASTDVASVLADPLATAQRLAEGFGVVVSLKGATTYTCTPDGTTFSDDAGNPGLGTSGSGDVAAGAVAGLAARGAPVDQAAVWGLHAHAAAGDRLAGRIGALGYLARELLDELPRALEELRTAAG